jgi:hypothetical protein
MPRTAAGQPTDEPLHTADKVPSAAQLKTALVAHYAAVQYHYVQFLAEHLTDCRKTLGGDFDDLMMLAVLGQRFLQARLAFDNGESEAEARVWMSALRLSDVTGVPRESVRRKLFRLEKRGWVTHDPALGWRLAGTMREAQARIDLGELDKRGLDRLARLLAGVMPLMTAPVPLAEPPVET